MAVHVPFVRWDIISHGANDSAEPRVYYLETAQREKVVCAIAIRGEGNHMTYRPLDSFLQEYSAVLPSSRILEWNFRFQLAAWLDGIVYYSFLQCSEEGVGSCWHLAHANPVDVVQGLRQYFLPGGSPTWILIAHGYRIWPVEVIDQQFGDGWDKFRDVHKLKPGYKVILACERRWIFHSIILDENDLEVRFHWSSAYPHHRRLHPPLRTYAPIFVVYHLASGKIIMCWCIANTNKIKQLPSMTTMKPLILTPGTSSSNDPVKIINLPTSIEKTQFINVQGIARVVNFNQRFYYLACSLCNKSSNAYLDEDFWCNYCAKKVPPLIRIKFNIEIEDSTGTIEAAVFPEIAEIIYGITGANIASTAPGESLPVQLLHKLNEPKNSSITLRAYMYSYAGITQLKFTVHSMSIETTTKKLASTAETLALPPPTPTKKEKANTPSASADPAETNPAKKQKLDSNEET